MQSYMPKTPFSTPLSSSGKETELRIQSIFRWEKKRLPVIFLVPLIFLLLYCFGLVAIIPGSSTDTAFEVSVGGIPTVISLNEYYTVEEIDRLIDKHGFDVQRAYLWEPGETGKLMLGIKNNNIRDALDHFIAGRNEWDAGPPPEEIAQFKVYAITTPEPIWKVVAFSLSEQIVARIDSMSFPTRQNFEHPIKPDGAQ